MKSVYTTFSLLLLATLLMSNENGRAFSQGKGNTGAPGDEIIGGGTPRTCKSCHSAGAFSPSMTIEVLNDADQPVTTYIPGASYTARVTVTASGAPVGYGFQMLSLFDSDNTDVAAWTTPKSSNVRIATASTNGRSYAEHLGQSATNVFTVTWVAPPAGSGAITFYAAANAVNDNDESGGDGGTTTTLNLTEMLSSTQNLASAMMMRLNANADNLTIHTKTANATNATLYINTLQGTQIMQQNIALNQGENTLRTDIATLPSGLYLVSIVLPNGQIATMKWVK